MQFQNYNNISTVEMYNNTITPEVELYKIINRDNCFE